MPYRRARQPRPRDGRREARRGAAPDSRPARPRGRRDPAAAARHGGGLLLLVSESRGRARAPPHMTAARSVPAVMSVDVEDWFHVENLKQVIYRDSWGRQSSRVERNVDRLLELMAGHGEVRCTWFILGWVAERWPQVVSRIAEAGHEIASHGYHHDLLDDLSRESFAADVQRSKRLLEDIGGA